MIIRKDGASRKEIIQMSNYVPIPFGGGIGKYLFKWSLQRESRQNQLGYKNQTCIGDDTVCQFTYDELQQFCKNRDVYFNGYWAEKYYSDWCVTSLQFRKSYIDTYEEY